MSMKIGLALVLFPAVALADPPAIGIDLPAISSDGKTVCLPTSAAEGGWGDFQWATFAKLGSTTGDTMALVDASGQKKQMSPDDMLEKTVPKLNDKLKAGGYAPLDATDVSDDPATVTLDGMTFKLDGGKVSVLANGKELAKSSASGKKGRDVHAIKVAMAPGFAYVLEQERALNDEDDPGQVWLALPIAAPAKATLDALRGGSPVYLNATPDGLFAHSLDGKLNQKLVPGPVGGAALDTVYDLLWYVHAGELDVLDLRDPAAKPVTIAKPVPDDPFVIHYPGGVDFKSEGSYGMAQLEVTWAAKPSYTATEVPLEEANDPDAQKQEVADAKRAKLVGADWLKGQLKRATRDKLPTPVSFPTSGKMKIKDCDDSRQLCGRQLALGKTGKQIVISGDGMGEDGSETMCSLYDPSAKKFASLGDPKTWSADPASDQPCDLDLDGTQLHWLLPGAVCDGSGCKDVDGRTLGWIDPSIVIGGLP